VEDALWDHEQNCRYPAGNDKDAMRRMMAHRIAGEILGALDLEYASENRP
jgi:hypothetical protein